MLTFNPNPNPRLYQVKLENCAINVTPEKTVPVKYELAHGWVRFCYNELYGVCCAQQQPLEHLQSEFDVTGTPLAWLRSYLASQMQFIKVSLHQLPAVHLHISIPQGFVLGPLLCAAYS